MRRRRVLLVVVVFLMTLPVEAMAAAGEAEAAEKFLGLPVALWKTANLLLLLGLLVWFMGKPFNTFFRKRREDLNERLDRALADREKALSLAAEMKVRLDRLEEEIEDVRRRAAADGDVEKAAQARAAEEEAEMLRRSAAEEIDRRLELAKAELSRTAAAMAADRARELVSRTIGPDDHRRIFEESVKSLGRAS